MPRTDYTLSVLCALVGLAMSTCAAPVEARSSLRSRVVAVARELIPAGREIVASDLDTEHRRRGLAGDQRRLLLPEAAVGAVSVAAIAAGRRLSTDCLWRPMAGDAAVGLLTLPGCAALQPPDGPPEVAAEMANEARLVVSLLRGRVGKRIPIQLRRDGDTAGTLEAVGILKAIDEARASIDVIVRRSAALAIAAWYERSSWRVNIVWAGGGLGLMFPPASDGGAVGEAEALRRALEDRELGDLERSLPAAELERVFFSNPRWGQPVVHRGSRWKISN